MSALPASADDAAAAPLFAAWRALADQAGDPMWVLAPNGNLLWANAPACWLIGLPREALLGQPAPLAPVEGAAPLATQLGEAADGRLTRLAAGLRHADGSRVEARLACAPLAEGTQRAVLVVAASVSEDAASDAALHRRLARETMLAEVSGRLVHATQEDLPAVIDAALALLGQTFGAQHGRLLLLDAGALTPRTAYAWEAFADAAPARDELNREIWRELRGGAKPLHREPAADAPAELWVPLIHGSELLGALGFARARNQAAWRQDDAAALSTVAALLATTLERQRLQTAMSRRLEFESLIGEISSSLLRTPANLLDQGIETALKQLADYLRADRAAVFLVSADWQRIGISHEVCAPNLMPAREALQDLPLHDFDDALATLSAAQTLVVSDRESLGAERQALRESLETFGLGGALIVPLIHASTVVGALGFGRHAAGIAWDAQEIALLRACADIIITTIQRLRMEQALRESDEKFSRVFLAMPDAVTITELDSGVVVETNPAFETLFGRGAEEAVGHSVIELNLWVDPAERTALVEDLKRMGIVRNREVRMRRSSGDVLDVLMSAVAIELRGQICVCTVVRDISKRKAAELALRRSERYQRAILDTVPQLLWMKDLHGRYTAVNQAFAQACGRETVEECVGLRAVELWPGPVAEMFEADESHALKSGLGRSGEVLVPYPHGARWCELFFSPLSDDDGQIIGTIGYAHDVTARREAEAALRRLNLELEARVKHRTLELENSVRELESFSYSVSHDLRSPLRGINGFAALLGEEYADRLDDTGRSHLKRICDATLRMSSLIDDMLDLARISRSPMRKTRVDLSAMAQEVVAELRAGSPGRKVTVDIEPGLQGDGDPVLLRTALANLLGNAWKFTGTRDDARIGFAREATGGETWFCVTDNGAGFDPTNAHLLFRPFSRLHRPTEFPGTGIGLATVQRVIQRHGGKVRAEGRAGGGARFCFSLG